MPETAAVSVTLEVRPPDHLLRLIMAVIVTLEVRPVTKMAKSVTNKVRHAKQDLTVSVALEVRHASERSTQKMQQAYQAMTSSASIRKFPSLTN